MFDGMGNAWPFTVQINRIQLECTCAVNDRDHKVNNDSHSDPVMERYVLESVIWQRLRDGRRRWLVFRHEASLLQQAALAISFAFATGLAAQVRIPLPFTPVPITLQTFAVLLAGIILGMRLGGLSQGIYVGAGVAGMPWFQGFGAGLGHVLGPTGGYLVGFVLAAILIGLVIDRYPLSRRLPVLIALLALANVLIIYGFGVSWFYIWSGFVLGDPMALSDVLIMTVIPFVPGDIVKLVGAAIVGALLLPNDATVKP